MDRETIKLTRSQDQNSTTHGQGHTETERYPIVDQVKHSLGGSRIKQLLALTLVSLASSVALFKGYKAIAHSSLMPSSILPSSTSSSALQQSHDTPAWLSKLLPFIDQSTAPQIVKTPRSFNVIYHLPGFTAEDLSITADDDTIYVDGRVSGDDMLRGVGITSGSRFAQQNGLTEERTIHAQTSIPRSIVSQQGNHDINAYLKNGVLRISICLDESTGGIQKRVVKLFSDVGHRFTHPSELFGRGKSTDYIKDKLQEGKESATRTYEQGRERAGDAVQHGQERASEAMQQGKDTMQEGAESVSERVNEARDTANEYIQSGKDRVGEYAQYGKEKMDEYVGKPVRDARDAAGNLLQKSREYVEDSMPNSDTIASMEKQLADMRERAKNAVKGESGEALKQVPVKQI